MTDVDAATGPLAGIRVVEMGSMVAIPYASANLAALGAEVVKIEPTSGDPTRSFVSITAQDHVAPAFLASNANKRSIAIDLQSEEGLQIALDLIATADVVMDNFRPGGLARRGFDVESLLARQPRLIWVSIGGYGQAGRNAQRSVVDQILQSESGVVAVTGPPDSLGYRVGFHVIDHAAAHVIVAKVLAALFERERTGNGQRIYQSMFDVALALQATSYAEYFVNRRNPVRSGNSSPLSAPSDACRTKDGAIMLVAYLEPHWEKMCTIIGRPDLLADPRFKGRTARVTNRGDLVGELERTTLEYTSEDLATMLDEAGVMVGQILQYDEVVASDEVQANQRVTDVERWDGHVYGSIRSVYDDGEAPRSGRLPALGEHTEEIMRELGREADVDRLLAAGVLASHS